MKLTHQKSKQELNERMFNYDFTMPDVNWIIGRLYLFTFHNPDHESYMKVITEVTDMKGFYTSFRDIKVIADNGLNGLAEWSTDDNGSIDELEEIMTNFKEITKEDYPEYYL